MAEIFKNREQLIDHVGIYIAEHRKRFSCIAGAFGQPIAGVQRRSVWLGLNYPVLAMVHPRWFTCDYLLAMATTR